jgi:hypothetical protein
VTEGGWGELPDELLAKVLELLQAGGRGGLGFSRASTTVRLVCAGWKAVYAALVRRLVLRGQTTDEAVGMLVRRFPAVASLEYKGGGWRVLTDEALRAVSSLPALTFLDLRHSHKVTAAGVQALRSTTAAPHLEIEWNPPAEDSRGRYGRLGVASKHWSLGSKLDNAEWYLYDDEPCVRCASTPAQQVGCTSQLSSRLLWEEATPLCMCGWCDL